MAVLFTEVTLLLIVSLPVSSSQVQYVHPFNGVSACTSEPCTFDQFAQNPEQYFLSDTTFIFLPGDHQLSISINLHCIHNVSLHGMLTEGYVTIRLGSQVGLSFDNCDGIEIRSLNFLLSDNFEYGLMLSETNDAKLYNITLGPEDGTNSTGCSAIVSQVSTINISDSSFVGINGQNGAALLALNSSRIIFTGVNNFSHNSANLGGAVHSVGSTLQFTGISSFTNNSAILNVLHENHTQSLCFNNNSNDSGMGGAIYAENSNVNISSCAQFLGNKATNLGGAIAVVNDSKVIIDGSSCFTELQPMIVTVLFDGNHVINGSFSYFMNVVRSGAGGAIFANDCVININNVSLINNTSPGYGGAAHFNLSNITLHNINAVNNRVDNFFGGAIEIYSCEQVHIDGENYFINNTAGWLGGAIGIYVVECLKLNGKNYFEGNKATFGGAIDIFIVAMNLICGDNVFKGNYARSNGGAVYVYNSTAKFCGENLFAEDFADRQGGALYIEASTIIFNGTTMFYRNMGISSGGAVASLDSQIGYYGKIQFHNNSATTGNGGAMALYGVSKLVLNPNTEVVFLENHAHCDGGAIYFQDSSASSLNCYVANDAKPECFIIMNTTYSLLKSAAASIFLNFTYNVANNYGTIMYGGQLSRCKLLFKRNSSTCGDTMEMKDQAQDIISSISTLDGTRELENNSIASPPLKLCLCDKSNTLYECTSTSETSFIIYGTTDDPPYRHKDIIPGQGFEIGIVALDIYNHSLKGIEISFDAQNGYTLTSENGITTIPSCKNFMYRLLADSDPLHSSAETNFSYTFYIPGLCRSNKDHVILSITVLPCPTGFEFSKKERKCVCNHMLKTNAECSVDNKSIKRSRNNFWIDITDNYFLIYEGSCPLDYCKDHLITIPSNEPDKQCQEGRTGNICGSCNKHENYSLILGSLECKKGCSNVYLLLIIPFGILGILLIALLFLLRLTVSEGTINGLIFYANIVQANHQILLPKLANTFIVTFISWVNLDFGIHTCFYNGMDIYMYSWLQFLFPLYLWTLVIIIIVSAHCSRRVSRRLGQNPVAVLATVLLISYGKMLKAIIVPLSPATLKNVIQPENEITPYRVWLYDGDTEYLGKRDHIVLVVFAILVLVFLFLPYTLLLLFGHWLQTKSHWRFLSWINKFKPLMDAYYAPFKKGKYYWLGLFLLARCVLFLSIAFTPLFNDYVINLVIVSTVIAGLSIIKGQIYEKWYNDFLESSFLLNLCVLSIASSYVQSEKPDQDEEKIILYQNILSHISIVVVFLSFIGIVVFHAYQRLRKRKLLESMRKRYYSLKKQHDEKAYDEQSLEIVTNSSVSLRELLLDDDS